MLSIKILSRGAQHPFKGPHKYSAEDLLLNIGKLPLLTSKTYTV
jgi:hypothetical protein